MIVFFLGIASGDYLQLGNSTYMVGTGSCPLGELYDFTQNRTSDILNLISTFNQTLTSNLSLTSNSSLDTNLTYSLLALLVGQISSNVTSLSNLYRVGNQYNSGTKIELNVLYVIMVLSLLLSVPS
jgi:hypothetical protein